MNYVTFIIRNLENVPGKSGVGQGEVREKSGKFCCQSLWEPCKSPYTHSLLVHEEETMTFSTS